VADADAIDKIVSNLIQNALQYTPEGGTVAVRVHPAPEDAPDASRTRIAVRNTGPGIPEPVQQTLFQRYASAAAGEQALDTGIGLALVHDLVDRHGGSVSVRDGDDVTEFAVDLPADVSALPPEDRADTKPGDPPPPSAAPSADRAAHRAALDGSVPEPPASPRAGAGGSSTEPIFSHRDKEGPASGAAMSPPSSDETAAGEDAPQVLVVEDEADLRDYLRDTLEPRYRVRTAGDASAALKAAQASRPDLIISDVRMPGPTGFELCEAVRNDDTLRAIPVILLTVEPRETGQLRGLSCGADAYVSKPFDPQSLRQRIENLIDVRQFLRSRSGTRTRYEGTSGETRASEDATPDRESEGPADEPAATDSFEATVRQVVESEIDNSSFGVAWLADEVGLSRRQLQRKIQDETGLSAAAYIRTVRLQRAAALLEAEDVTTVSGAAEAVGYRDPSHFSRIFREAYGISPSDYPGADPA
jgi:DNA-binding response OmpR family regulator